MGLNRVPKILKYKGKKYKNVVESFPTGYGVDCVIKVYERTENLLFNRWKKVYEKVYMDDSMNYYVRNSNIESRFCEFYGFKDIISLLKYDMRCRKIEGVLDVID
jgi:hypothetical protein